jgi:hypothetical protein
MTEQEKMEKLKNFKPIVPLDETGKPIEDVNPDSKKQ